MSAPMALSFSRVSLGSWLPLKASSATSSDRTVSGCSSALAARNFLISSYRLESEWSIFRARSDCAYASKSSFLPELAAVQ